MPDAHDLLFRTLADPTRRAIFERLCREGEQTVGALTARAGVSQPAVSKHLGVLKQAGLVRDRHEGRQTHYSAQLGALAPLIDWTSQMAGFWQSRFDRSRRSAQKDGPMSNTATETRSVVVEREIPYPPEKIWRALTQPHLIEEWLMKNDFKPVVDHRFNLRARLGRRRLPGPGRRAEQDAVLHVGGLWLESVVTWTLTPTSTGTHLRMEQSGFRPDQQQAYQGARAGGSSSLRTWSRSWRGSTEIRRRNSKQAC